MWLSLGAAWWLDDPDATHLSHPRIEHIEVGGSRAVSDRQLIIPGGCFAAFMVLFFHHCLRMGAGSRWDESALLRWLFRGATIVVLVLVLGGFLIYERQDSTLPVRLWGPLPAATVWAMLGVGFAPVLYTFIYVLGFNRWFANQSDSREGR